VITFTSRQLNPQGKIPGTNWIGGGVDEGTVPFVKVNEFK